MCVWTDEHSGRWERVGVNIRGTPVPDVKQTKQRVSDNVKTLEFMGFIKHSTYSRN